MKPRNPYSYFDEKFTNPLYSLATSSHSLQKRLHFASIDLIALRAEHFDDVDMRSKFEEIDRRLAQLGSVPETVAQMTNDEAEAIAKEIFGLAMAERGLRTAVENPAIDASGPSA